MLLAQSAVHKVLVEFCDDGFVYRYESDLKLGRWWWSDRLHMVIETPELEHTNGRWVTNAKATDRYVELLVQEIVRVE